MQIKIQDPLKIRSKIQAPRSREDPNSKIQSERSMHFMLHIASRPRSAQIGTWIFSGVVMQLRAPHRMKTTLAPDWILELGSSLDLGAWILELTFRGSWIFSPLIPAGPVY